MMKALKYDCFQVTLKITPLLTSKAALFLWHKFIDTTYADPNCFTFNRFIHAENDLKLACNPQICSRILPNLV